MSGQRKALIIANDEYEQEALSNLLAPGADAEALGRVLGDAQIGDFSVQVVRNEPSYVIQAQIEDLFSESRSDDLLLLHFSGHGLKSESGELFFAASNTKPNRLASTAVSADFVQRCMRDARSRSVVLLLDCCYGGAFSQGVKVRAAGDVNVLDSFPQGRLGGGRGRAIITASGAMEYAFEGDRLADDQHRRPSVFTSALVEGLTTGDADRDEDGLVSLNELYEYVFDKVREQNPHQTPSRQVELEGELYLARSRRQRIRPAPIPPDLQAAIADPNMYTRRGAVHELQSRLASEDLPVALGAYQALAELARTDIRYVADLAAAALSQAAVRPEETELHFGEQRQGSQPPHRMVRLLGPPIARACVPRASHDWIRVNQTDEEFDISVDTTSRGTLRGSIVFTGPTGTAVIAIDVEFLPQLQPVPPQTAESHRNHGPSAPESSTSPSSVQTPARQAEENVAHKVHREETARQTGDDTVRKAFKEADSQAWEEVVRQSREEAERGEASRLAKRYDEALADLDSAIELDPNYVFALYNRGDTYRMLNRYDEALADLDRAVELDPNYVLALASRGTAYQQLKRSDEALADLDRAVELDPNYAFALASRGETYRLAKRYDEALADSDRAIQLDPNYVFALYSRGETYRMLNRYDEALADLDRAVELDPNYVLALASRGTAYQQLKRSDEALADLDRAVELDPDYVFALYNRGVTYRMLKRYDEALADLDRAIQLDPNYTWANHERREIYRLMKRP